MDAKIRNTATTHVDDQLHAAPSTRSGIDLPQASATETRVELQTVNMEDTDLYIDTANTTNTNANIKETTTTHVTALTLSTHCVLTKFTTIFRPNSKLECVCGSNFAESDGMGN